MNGQLIHLIPGRIRLAVPEIRREPELARPLEALVRARPEVVSARANPGAASITVSYEGDFVTARRLVRHVRGLTLGSLHVESENGANGRAELPPPVNKRGMSVALSVAAAFSALMGMPSLVPLSPPLFLLGGRHIFTRAVSSLVNRRELSVDALDSAATLALTAQRRYGSAALLIALVNVSEYVRGLTAGWSRGAIEKAFELQVESAWIERNGEKIEVPIDDIRPGDIVVVYPGDLIPVDGEITSGRGLVDQHVLTGESLPVSRETGDTVFASTVLADGKMYIRATGVGQSTEVANIVRMVQGAPTQETRIQDHAQRLAGSLVPWSLGGALAAAILSSNRNRPTSLLIADYATGIRVAAPTTILSAMTRAARNGMIFKGGRHLESLATIDTVVVDKTGTLTTGKPAVVAMKNYTRTLDDETLIGLAAAAEQRLIHPLGRAVVAEAEKRGIAIAERFDSDYSIGMGIKAQIDHKTVHVGSKRFMEHLGFPIRKRAGKHADAFEETGATVLYVAVDGRIASLMACADAIRAETPGVIAALRRRDVNKVVILTGDRAGAANYIARRAGIGTVISEVMPQDKADHVTQMMKDGRRVAFLGDGINDSPAIVAANVGIAVTGGADLARETADIVLLGGGLWKVPVAMDISQQAVDLVKQNWRLVWVPNSVAIALATLGVVTPAVTTLISNGSTIAAALNSLKPLYHPEYRAEAEAVSELAARNRARAA